MQGKAHLSLQSLPADLPPCALTIGNFDGIHLGHQKIVERTLARARQFGLQAVVLTFDPHPMRVVAPERAPALLTLPAQRIERLEAYGIDRAVILKFTPAVARLSPDEFVLQVLVGKLHVRWVVVGENFRFGHRGSGDFRTLQRLGKAHGFDTEAVAPVLVGGKPVSSTRVRELIRLGRVDQARRLLRRPFSLQGNIVPGTGVGKRHTVPTLNLQSDTDLLPARGVYITSTRDLDSDRRWQSVTNIGYRPTFNGADQTVETFLLSEFDGQRPTRIELAFHWRLRDERRFDSAERLRQQILIDASRAERFFRRLRAAGRGKLTIGS